MPTSQHEFFCLTPFYRRATNSSRQPKTRQFHRVSQGVDSWLAQGINQLCQHHQLNRQCLMSAVTAIYFAKAYDHHKVGLVTVNSANSAVWVNGEVSSQMTFLNQLLWLQQLIDNAPPLLDRENSAGFAPQIKVLGQSGGSGADLTDNLSLTVSLSYDKAKQHIQLELLACADYFTEPECQLLLTRLLYILEQGVTQSNAFVAQLMLTPTSESSQLAAFSQGSDHPFPAITLAEQFEQQAKATPDNVALLFSDTTITYQQLNHRANQLARYIEDKLLSNEPLLATKQMLVSLYFDKSVEMVVAMLAVLKLGGAYVPISPSYPQARAMYILNDTSSVLLLSQQQYAKQLALWCCDCDVVPQVVYADDAQCSIGEVQNLKHVNQSTDLAYVIYTSGTTGPPKGVMISHNGVSNLIAGQTRAFNFDSSEVVAWMAAYTFDASVEQLYLALLNGGALFIPNEQQIHDTQQLKFEMIRHRVTHLHATPGYLLALGEFRYQQRIKRVISGGDVIDVKLKQLWSTDLINEYGPTESTVTAVQCCDYAKQTSVNCIGKPVNQTQAYVLSIDLTPVPIGVVGELYLSGEGVALGYLNSPQLTASCFIISPFSQHKHARLYKTGDMVRWLTNGNLEFIGRNDHQVKIRGMRIELGEIQQLLSTIAGVEQAVVIDREHAGSRFLAAYIVPSSQQKFVLSVVKKGLSSQLPEFMVPKTFICLDKIPLTVNGKLDKSALPAPIFNRSDNHVAPNNKLEHQLCQLWQEVLGVAEVGVTDNFFALGGDSLIAIKLMVQLQKSLGFNVSGALMFQFPDIRELAQALTKNTLAQVGQITNHHQRDYPLSIAQQGLWFIDSLSTEQNAYLMPFLFKLANTDMKVLQQAFDLLIARHPVLNSSHGVDDNGIGVQRSLDSKVKIKKTLVNDSSQLMVAIKQHIAEPLDLSSESPLKLHHYKVANEGLEGSVLTDKAYLLLLVHHIAFDGWSTDVLMGELAEVYQALVNGQAVELSELTIGYGDYVLFQQQQLQGERLTLLQQYWQTQLAGFEPLVLLTDYSRPPVVDYQGKDFDFSLDVELSNQLRVLAKSQNTTLYTVMLSGLYITLGALSGQTDIVIGTPTDNRDHYQTQSLIGLLVHSLVLRAQVDGEQSIEAFIGQVHQVVSSAKNHQALPYELLVRAMDLPTEQGRQPIFQVMFGLQNFFGATLDDAELMQKLPFDVVEPQLAQAMKDCHSPAKFDLSLFMRDDGQGKINGVVNFATSLFALDTIKSIAQMYQRVLVAFVDSHDSQQPIGHIDMLSAKQHQTILYSRNETQVEYPNVTLSQLFEQQVVKTPTNTALIFATQSLSYSQLNDQANGLANTLNQQFEQQFGQPIGPDTFIVLYLERSIDMIIAILAVLKAGGTYVPISPGNPKERLQYMLQDTGAGLIITATQHQSSLQDSLLKDGCQSVFVMNGNWVPKDSENVGNPIVKCNALHMACLLYTSGTTGDPKGVQVLHKGLISLLYNNKTVGISDQDMMVQLSNPSFDIAAFEIWGALLNGAKLVIAPVELNLDAVSFKRFISEYRPSILWLTKSLFDQLFMAQADLFDPLRCLLIGGEALNPTLISQLIARKNRPQTVINGYGPTESTAYTTLWCGESFTGSVPLGGPTNNRKVYVLNAQRQPVGIGCPGELYIGGDGLARGYLNQPELTEQCFINNPFVDDANARMYKSGDLVRWLANGKLEYLGRNDNQVKINGFRIELEEIQSVLRTLPDIAQAVVIDRASGQSRYLAAYVVAKDNCSMTAMQLEVQLAQLLPDYMVPATFVFIDAIPLTPSAKLDKRALPQPVFSCEEQYVAPSSDFEQQLSDIWQEVLLVDKIGIDDNFFALGGNSISAIALIAKMARRLKLDVPLAVLFEWPDIRRLADHLQHNDDYQRSRIIPHQEHAHYPLSFSQERLLFIESFEQGSDAYHIPFFVGLKQVDLGVLQQSFDLITERHPILKTVYLNADSEGNYQQLLTEQPTIECHLVNDHNQLLQLAGEHISKPFDLSAEPSAKFHHYVVESQTSKTPEVCDEYLLMVFHHIGFDGWSSDIFMQELALIYQGICNRVEPNLPILEISFGDYAQWQREQQQGQTLQQLQNYWQTHLAGFETSSLATDRPRPAIPNYRGRNFNIGLSHSLSTQLRALASAQHTSLFSVLLSGLYVTLATMSGQQDIVVGTPSDNRQQFQTQSLIGYFVNSLALRAKIDSSQSVKSLLAQVHQIITKGKAHEQLPFEKVVDLLNVERDTSRHPIYQVMFTVQSFFEGHSDDCAMNQLPFEPVDRLTLDSLYCPAKFDLSLFVNDGQAQINCVFNYALSLFDEPTINRIATIYQRVLSAFVDVTQQVKPIAQIEVLSSKERAAFLAITHSIYPSSAQPTFVHQFASQVASSPDSVALVCDQQSMTYRQLNDQANLLARAIIDAYQLQFNDNMPLETLIGLYLDRSMQTIISILAVLKSGGAYVPIDITLPTSRVTYILNDIKAHLVLTTTHQFDALSASINETEIKPIVLLADDIPLERHPSSIDLKPIAGPQHLAYVLYTSGTTGQPKGVMLTQGAFAGFIAQASTYLSESLACEKISTLSLTPYTFDIFGLEFAASLASGGLLVLSKSNTAAVDLNRYHAQLNFIQQTPSMWQLLLLDESFMALSHHYFAQIQIMVGGESGSLDLFASLERLFAKVHQVYGPTETCIWSTRCVYSDNGQNIIGQPFPHEQVYILSDTLQLKPIGAPGHLYIGGAGLARGYLNQPALTESVFISNPFDGGKTRLYKTGDRARWLNRSALEFLGRDDDQIKLRGYRIELGEIERVLAQHPMVNTAVVIFDKQPQNSRLLGYVTLNLLPQSATQTDVEHANVLRDWLKGHLPGYMLPAQLVVLDEFALNTSGKINRKALSLPKVTSGASPTSKTAGQLAQQMTVVWLELLALEHIDVDDNFFDVGGHSLLIAKLKLRLDDVLDKPVTLLELFQYPTIASLTAYLDETAPIAQHQATANSIDSSSASPAQIEDIAIVGMAGRFPGAGDIDEFWHNLREGICSIHTYSDAELLAQGIDSTHFHQSEYVKRGGMLAACDQFDAQFFGYSPFEAQLIDPQQRIFLETAWTSIEHAGFDVQKLDCEVAVFGGMSNHSYLHRYLMNNPEVLARQGEYKLNISNKMDYLCSRVAYKLGLQGAAVSVQTACSTALVAVHMACQSIRQGECDMALAGATTVHSPQEGYLYQQGMISSPDGYCRAFDADAQGIVDGSGVGMVVLMPLSRAKAQGCTVYAVVKGSAINNDGKDKVGFTAPSVNGQAAVISKAMQGLDFESISYVEAHGTATPMGDPIEVAALTQAYAKQTQKKGYCALGSVKTNIGHLDVAAGIAGLIKTTQALWHQQLPPSLNFKRPNPNIDFSNSPFYVNQQLQPWQSETPRRAAVSAFSIGGTNAHIILEQAPQQPLKPLNQSAEHWHLLCLSAKSETALSRMSDNLIAHVKSQTGVRLNDIAFTLHQGRSLFDHRQFMLCREGEGADESVNRQINRRYTNHVEGTSAEVVFMFPGQGSQFVGMGKELYEQQAVFTNAIDQCNLIIKHQMELDLLAVMYGHQSADLNATELAQPALFITQYALAQLCLSWGISPIAMIGHSLGEYVGACLAGVFSLTDALKLVIARGRLMQSMEPGDMLSVALATSNVQQLLTDGVVIAAVNAPEQCVVSGTKAAISAFILVLDDLPQVPTYKLLHTSHAFHSPMMAEVIPPFLSLLQQITLHPPSKPCISNLTGQWLSDQQATSVDYWCQHLLSSVQFNDGIETLLSGNAQQSHNLVFLELGPGRALSGMVQRHKDTKAYNAMGFAKSKDAEQVILLNAIGQLWLNHIEIDWEKFYQLTQCNRVAIPTYSFEQVRHWVEPSVRRSQGISSVAQQHDLSILPKEKWLSAPHWDSICNVTECCESPLFESVLLFVTDSQFQSIDFGQLSDEYYFVILQQSVSQLHEQDPHHFWLDPLSEKGYQMLMNSSLADKTFTAIIHLASSDGKLETQDPLDFGFYSLFMIKEYLLPKLSIEHLLVMTADLAQIDNNSPIKPLNGALVGGIRNINHRYPHINALVIDVGDQFTVNGLANKGKTKVDFSFLTQILNHTDLYQTNALLAFRFGKLWCQYRKTIMPLCDSHPLIKDNDTIVFTGGLGGIGLALAKHISVGHNVNFVLLTAIDINRSGELPAWKKRKISVVQQIRKNGCHVDIHHIDIADVTSVKAIVVKIQARYKVIDGIIHTTGVMPLSVTDHSLEKERASFKGKVYGIENLINNVDLANLRFLANTSSLASIIGHVHRIEYCAANSYLDYLCADRLRFKNTTVVTMNWPGWSDVSLASTPSLLKQPDTNSQCDVEHMRRINAVNEQEGAELFCQLLNQSAYEQVIISKLDIEAMTAQSYSTKLKAQTDTWTLVDEHYSSLEYQTAQVFHWILGVDEISVEDDFFSLGGNSLLAVQLMAQLKTAEINIDMSNIINGDSIRTIAAQADHQHEIIIALNERNNNGNNVFFVHPVGGTVVLYKPFIENLDSSYDYFGIQNINAYHKQLLKPESLCELATIYVEALLVIQPEGEYRLVGSSLGGTIAFEMARQLTSLGKKIAFVAMLDSWATYSAAFADKEIFVEQMRSQQAKYFADLAALDKTTRDTLMEASWGLMALLRTYHPVESDFTVHLFKADAMDDIHATNLNLVDNGWQQYVTGDFEVYGIAGDHLTIHFEEGLSQICAHLNQLLIVDHKV